jgi:hypothetical protein
MSGFKIVCNNCNEVIEITENEAKEGLITVYSGHKEVEFVCKCGNVASFYAIS